MEDNVKVVGADDKDESAGGSESAAIECISCNSELVDDAPLESEGETPAVLDDVIVCWTTLLL